jgi:Zn-dependent membrane protease YugP
LGIQGLFVFHRDLLSIVQNSRLSVQLAFAAPLLLFLGLIYAVYRGYNWARIIVTAEQAIAFLIAALPIAFSAHSRATFLASGAESAWMVIRLLIAAAAILLLYTARSNLWFKRPRASRAIPPPAKGDS